MTSVRDRRDELDKPRAGSSGRTGAEGATGSATGNGSVPWDHRMLFGQAKGMSWWAAALLGFGLAIVAGFVDHGINNSFGGLFQGAYFVGCVGAICLVRRNNLFAPMVQPPLVLAVAVPVAALLGGSSSSGSMKSQILTVGTPLINQFPAMAVTTVLTVGVGIARLYVQRKPAGRLVAGKQARTAASKPPAGARTTKARPPQARQGQNRTSKDRTTKAIPAAERAAQAAAAAGRPTRARPPARRPAEGATRANPRRDERREGERTTRQPRPADAQRRRDPREGDPRRRDPEGRPRRPRQDPDRREEPPRQRAERRRDDPRRGEPPRSDPQRRREGQPRGGSASARERARQIRENTEREVPPRRRDETGRKQPPRNRRRED